MNLISSMSHLRNMGPWTRQTAPHRVSHPTSGPNVGGWERVLSAGLGLLLMNKSRQIRGMKSYLLGMAGLALLNRGISGQCNIYRSMGVSSTT